MTWLNELANVSAIFTALIAVIAYGNYRWDGQRKRQRLEGYLKTEKDDQNDRGQRTILHLMAALEPF